jgi:peptidoglycan/LPS O-acetylase OafA/YrhL
LICQITVGMEAGTLAHFLTYNFPPYRVPEFVIGIALAFLLRAGFTPAKSTQLAAAAITTAGVTLSLLADLFHIALWWAIDAFMLPGIVVLIWTSARRELAGRSRFLTNARLVRLGDRSFSFYMVHYLVLGYIGLLVGQKPQALPWWLVPPSLITAAVLAGLTYRFIEKPCERALRDLLSSTPFRSPAARTVNEGPAQITDSGLSRAVS